MNPNNIADSKPMPLPWKLAVGLYIATMHVALLWLLVRIWPATLEPATSLSMDGRFLLCAASAGALGSMIHLASSFIEYAGKCSLERSWGWWYFLRPFIGSALAVVVYFVIRGGFVSGTGDVASASVNPYGICSLGALTGMFSKHATERLRHLFEHICNTPQPSPIAEKN